MRLNSAPIRKLHRAHFAFMRALVQGVDERASWDRYLRNEGEHSDFRTVRRTIAWIRDAFAAAARRESRPGTARLILLDPDRFGQETAQGAEGRAVAPTSLEDFAIANGLEDFSEAEQIEAYESAYPKASGSGRARKSRRSRVVERQLEALRWLEELAVQDPKPGDSVSAWFNPSIAARLESAGASTLFALVERINGLGARWWLHIPGIGAGKAARLVDWLRANETILGMPIGSHVVVARSQVSASALDSVVPRSTALVPFEKLILPTALNGSTGKYRAPVEQCVLLASNDYEAIGAWINAKGAPGSSGKLTATQRSYRKETERLLLWCILERKKPLSSLTVEDAIAFREFLAAPPADWCGPRHHQRWSPMWRPLEGPVSSSGQRQALTILKSLYNYLISQGYLAANSFATIAKPRAAARPLGSSRTLSIAQWDYVDRLLKERATSEQARRLHRAMRLLYATGLRLEEVVSVRTDDLYPFTYPTSSGQPEKGWMLAIRGKGTRTREIPVPLQIIKEFESELGTGGYEPDVKAVGNIGVRLIARFDPRKETPAPWSASGLYKAIVKFVGEAAKSLTGEDAEHLRSATTHWLRHTYASHALQGREGRPPVPIQAVQSYLGHASLGTTSGYLSTEQDAHESHTGALGERKFN